MDKQVDDFLQQLDAELAAGQASLQGGNEMDQFVQLVNAEMGASTSHQQGMDEFLQRLDAELAAGQVPLQGGQQMDQFVQLVDAELGASTSQQQPLASTSQQQQQQVGPADPAFDALLQTWNAELEAVEESRKPKSDFDEYLQSIERYLEIDELISSRLALVDERELYALYPAVARSPPRPSTGHYLEQKMLEIGTPEFYTMLWDEDFVTSYDPRFKISMWGFEWLTKGDASNAIRVDKFITDDELHPFFQSLASDYKRMGKDKGHMVPAGDMKKTQKAMAGSFKMSNMCPQEGLYFNRGIWSYLERRVRNHRDNPVYSDVYCLTGSLVLPIEGDDGVRRIQVECIGENDVVVPNFFYKFVLLQRVDGRYELESYKMPNAPIDAKVNTLDDFFVIPELLEREAGHLVFNNIKRDQMVRINDEPTPYDGRSDAVTNNILKFTRAQAAKSCKIKLKTQTPKSRKIKIKQ